MITYPNAKINLGLNIVEKRPDGYHNLETVFYPINLQDALEVTKLDSKDEEYKLKVSGVPIEGEPENNLVVKAYRLLKKDYPDMAPIDIHMYKHIPTVESLYRKDGRICCHIGRRLCILYSEQAGICQWHRKHLREHQPIAERILHRISQAGHLRID